MNSPFIYNLLKEAGFLFCFENQVNNNETTDFINFNTINERYYA